ncbi:unnamed protein product, partial [Linum tenue]
KKGQVASEGCFTVYLVGRSRDFFGENRVLEPPLLWVLLEEVESEFEYSPEGPLPLPCQVACFWKVLVAMDSEDERRQGNGKKSCLTGPPNFVPRVG